MRTSRSLRNDRLSYGVFTYSKVLRCLSIRRCIFIPFTAPSLLFFTMEENNIFLFQATFSAFRITNFGVVFSKNVLPYARKQSFTKHKILCWLDVLSVFETTTSHFVDQSPSHQKTEHAMMPAHSCLLVAPLKGEYGYETFITKSPIFGTIGIRTFPTGHKWMLFAMFVFLFCSVFVKAS